MHAVEQRLHSFANITAILFGLSAAVAAAILFLDKY